MPALNIYDLGDRTDLGYAISNASGVPVDATVTVESVNPSAVASALSPSHVATGVYSTLLDFDVPGRWYVTWRATGAAHDAETVTLLVRPNAPTRSDDSYANIDDVVRLVQGREFTASSKPAISDVVDWLNSSAVEIDGLLRRGGYGLPVPTTATAARALLAHGNALGAACLIESSAPTSSRAQMACKLYETFKKSILAGDLELDAAKDGTSSSPRSNAANQATGMFTRSMLDSHMDF